MDEYLKFIKRMGVVGIANVLISISGLIFIPIITKSFSTHNRYTNKIIEPFSRSKFD
jgi:O-antigen/teichoic acid export membrane protein